MCIQVLIFFNSCFTNSSVNAFYHNCLFVYLHLLYSFVYLLLTTKLTDIHIKWIPFCWNHSDHLPLYFFLSFLSIGLLLETSQCGTSWMWFSLYACQVRQCFAKSRQLPSVCLAMPYGFCEQESMLLASWGCQQKVAFRSLRRRLPPNCCPIIDQLHFFQTCIFSNDGNATSNV